MSKKLTSMILAVCMLLSCIAVGTFTSQAVTTSDVASVAAVADVATTDSGSQDAQDSIQGSAVLHCFDWSYNNIKAKLADIAAAGYTAIQTSPVQSPKDYSASWTNQSEQWWKLYQPISINIADGDTWLGTKAELQALCTEAEKYNIKVIVDIVANHMANVTDSGGNSTSNISTQVESVLRSNSNYWHINDIWADDGSRYNMTQGSIGEPDLNTGNSYIQQRYKDLLIECISLGVDGFRFDAAKHIELPTDSGCSSQFWPTVINGSQSSTSEEIYYYGEILNTAGTTITNYTQYMSVTDNKTGDGSLVAANNNNADWLASSTYELGASASKSVLWVESHDTYMGTSGSQGITNTSGVSDSTIVKAWAITGSRANSTSLFFARPAATMGSASTDTTWKSTAVAEVNKFKNYFDGETEYLSSSGNVAYNERGTTGVVISKLDGSGSVSLTAHKMQDGTYKDQVSGNTFTVSNGVISGTVGSTGVAVVYNVADPGPSASVTPGTSTYKTDTLTLTLNYKNATSGQYSIDGGAYTSYTDGKTITIGSGVAYGASTTVSVKASDGSTTSDVVTYTYTKVDPSAVQTIYFDNSSYNWSKVYAYIYAVGADDELIENAAWPGVEMTYNSSTKLYEIEVSEKLSNGYVIFTESYSTTTNRYPADGETGLSIDGKSMLFSANHSWKEYVPTPTTSTTVAPTTVAPTTVAPTTVASTTTGNNILIGDVDLSGNITVDDATVLQKYLVEMISLSDDALLAAEIDGASGIDIRDVTAILCYLVDLFDLSGNCGQYVYGTQPTTAAPTTIAPTTVAPTTVAPTTVAPTTVALTTASSTYTMTFTNNYSWSNVYCYYWNDDDTTLTSWPGVKMSYSTTNDYGQYVYTLTIPSTATHVIFNNGNNGGQQTVDIDITGSARYYISGGSGTTCQVSTW